MRPAGLSTQWRRVRGPGGGCMGHTSTLCLAAIPVSGHLGLLVLVLLGQPAALLRQEQPGQPPAPAGLHPHPRDPRAERRPAGRPGLPPGPEDAPPRPAGRVPDPPARVPQGAGGRRGAPAGRLPVPAAGPGCGQPGELAGQRRHAPALPGAGPRAHRGQQAAGRRAGERWPPQHL